MELWAILIGIIFGVTSDWIPLINDNKSKKIRRNTVMIKDCRKTEFIARRICMLLRNDWSVNNTIKANIDTGASLTINILYWIIPYLHLARLCMWFSLVRISYQLWLLLSDYRNGKVFVTGYESWSRPWWGWNASAKWRCHKLSTSPRSYIFWP